MKYLNRLSKRAPYNMHMWGTLIIALLLWLLSVSRL